MVRGTRKIFVESVFIVDARGASDMCLGNATSSPRLALGDGDSDEKSQCESAFEQLENLVGDDDADEDYGDERGLVLGQLRTAIGAGAQNMVGGKTIESTHPNRHQF